MKIRVEEKIEKKTSEELMKKMFIFGLFGLTLYFIYKKKPLLALLTAIPGVPPL